VKRVNGRTERRCNLAGSSWGHFWHSLSLITFILHCSPLACSTVGTTSFPLAVLAILCPFAMSVSMSGFLDKAGEKGLVKRCKTRWFEVVGTAMNYSKSKSDTLIGFIDLKSGMFPCRLKKAVNVPRFLRSCFPRIL
jgi:hypothetical protein